MHTHISAVANTINSEYIAINCVDNIGSTVSINSNIITDNLLSWHTSYGININEVLTPPTPIYSMVTNTINATSSGIYALDLAGATVYGNTISTSGLGSAGRNEGVYIGQSNHSLVNDNTVSITGPAVAPPDGIRLDHSGLAGTGSNTIACNTITALNNTALYDLSFTGPQTPSTIVDRNTINISNSSNIGLYLYPAGTIGKQVANATNGSTDNSWNVWSGPQWVTYAGGTGSNPTGNPTIFYVQLSANGPTYPTVGANGHGFGLLSIPFISTGQGDGNHTCPWPRLLSPNKVLDSATAMNIITDSSQFTAYPETSHWFDKLTAFTYLTQTDSSLTVNPAIMHFKDSVMNSNMGKIVEINQLLADTNGVSYLDLVEANNLNDSLINPDTTEQVYQAVYGVLINMYASGTNFPNPAQISILQQIAPLCPAQYGGGVYIARAALSQVDTTIYNTTCDSIISRDDDRRMEPKKPSKEITTSSIPPVVKVYPNPANTLLNVQIALQPGEVAQICLYNSIGQLVQCEELQNNITTIPTSALAEGIYYYRIIDENGTILKADKQLITH